MILRFVLSLLAITATLFAQGNPDWHRAVPGFKLAGNLYYVGTADLAVYLVHTPQGNILINSDFKQDVPAIRASIEKLGFKYDDTKIILISHAHGDHDEGVGVIKQETGAKLMVMDADVPDVESTSRGRPGAHVDRILHDGDTVELGGSKLTARLTPGHTKGCTTWTMQVQDGGRKLNAVIIGSPNVNPGYILVGNTKYPQIAEDYVKTFAVLKSLPCDLFLGAHGAYFGMLAKYDKVKAGGPNPFIDPQGYRAYVDEREATFRKEWARQKNAPPSASGTVPDSLRRSLSFHASFDKGMDADVARGDRAIYHATDYKPQSATQPGQGDVDVAIEKGTGIAGSDALRFRSKNTRALFFEGIVTLGWPVARCLSGCAWTRRRISRRVSRPYPGNGQSV